MDLRTEGVTQHKRVRYGARCGGGEGVAWDVPADDIDDEGVLRLRDGVEEQRLQKQTQR
jgi:hypothetical protein